MRSEIVDMNWLRKREKGKRERQKKANVGDE